MCRPSQGDLFRVSCPILNTLHLALSTTGSSRPTKSYESQSFSRLRVVLDRPIELSLRGDVRADPESDQDRATSQYVAMSQCTRSLRSSPLRGSRSREAGSQLRVE